MLSDLSELHSGQRDVPEEYIKEALATLKRDANGAISRVDFFDCFTGKMLQSVISWNKLVKLNDEEQ